MENEVMTIEEAARFLRVSKVQIYRLVRAGELAAVKRGKGYTRFLKKDLLAFLERYRKEAIS